MRSNILQKYGVSPKDLLGKGMEAEAYRVDDGTVLKIYNTMTDFKKLQILKDFYDSLDASEISYGLPTIYRIVSEDGALITFEKELVGEGMNVLLPDLSDDQLESFMRTYLSAVLELRCVKWQNRPNRYKLFDAGGISKATRGDWHAFLKAYLTKTLAHTDEPLRRDVRDFEAKLSQIFRLLSQKYRGSYSLIHGDFFPGNLLVNADCRITGLLDFGLMTMYGDYLFDVATAWAFFDMYDSLGARIWDRYLAVIIRTLGESVRSKLYLYVLIYSMLSANIYAEIDDAGDHYRWCVANLNNAVLWEI